MSERQKDSKSLEMKGGNKNNEDTKEEKEGEGKEVEDESGGQHSKEQGKKKGVEKENQ